MATCGSRMGKQGSPFAAELPGIGQRNAEMIRGADGMLAILDA